PQPLFPNIDGVKFLTGLDWSGQILSASAATGIFWPVLAGYCAHPNVGGITLLCRDGATYHTDLLGAYINRCDPAFAKPLLVADRMDYPGEFDWMAAATRETFEAMTVLNRQTRQPAPLSRLTIGVRCAQDSGFSAYPAVSQYTTLLAEWGATVLMADPGCNASLREASHPCARFQSPSEQGLSVFHLPGDATEITTALTAAGCTLHVSTMALARPMGNPIAPVAQLAATPTRRNRLMEDDMDTNGDYLVTQTAETILNYSLKVASGEAQTLSESQGMDDFKVYCPQAG
ncbi:MAG: UxaA family hydrolase, partial [Bacteroidetes bacterium]|nr:UxaA family hydrolase [Fibrella sp.]